MSCGDFILLVISLIFPPLPVAIKRGLCSVDLLINLLLSLLGFLPGLIHAFYIVLKYPEHLNGASVSDLEQQRQSGAHVRHVYQPVVSGSAHTHQGQPQQVHGNMQGVYGTPGAQPAKKQQQQQQPANYGAVQGSSSTQAPPAYTPGTDNAHSAGDRKT
ncbi:hypothetical protein BCR37DRAFT_251721 [Protomyces lactucae-debilis]|uniref:Uncharacterized protein n=1 Tax=Protomyces lactucae-debilis TaxID=2754530 RepID=A0A1Y2FLE6_PROLT|nr:uncharacterized protein BCR37DRAFT_251721 [Protomyces lactucae-debilis]ORY84790.1 hypothetical protein BCR37DRAFT_251721 [Protomyces lactucae-debilis]